MCELLRKSGIQARRVVLSGRRHPDVLDADLVVEGKWLGKAKTTKSKQTLSFLKKELEQLRSGYLRFLVFNFKRTRPFVVVRHEDVKELGLKQFKQMKHSGQKYVSFSLKQLSELKEGKVDCILFHDCVVLRFEDFLKLLKLWRYEVVGS